MDWLLPEQNLNHPFVYVLVTVVAFLTTGISKGGFGGVGILAIPLMMIVTDGRFALGMWLPLLILCDILTIRAYPKEWNLRPILLLAPWMIGGLIIGCMLLNIVKDYQVKLFVGTLAILFVVLEGVKTLVKRRLEQTPVQKSWQPNWITAAPFGLAAGICTMIAHAAGAITTIYFLPQRLGKRGFVGTSARFYFVFNTLKVLFFAHPRMALINQDTLIKGLWLVPLAPLSVWLGAKLNQRISSAAFNRVIYVLLMISGLYLLYSNTIGRTTGS